MTVVREHTVTTTGALAQTVNKTHIAAQKKRRRGISKPCISMFSNALFSDYVLVYGPDACE
jgi:hypothetical protein